ncbi:glycosyltransferase family 4 protein [Psychrosphaera haliotis]|uniref:glycosyltransferase family 4 protein n=1 Tax=Psychrosphaera haliotis TaxID=555083 RepID=UPI0012DA591E
MDADRSDIVKPLNVLFFSNLRKGKGIFDFYIAIRNIIKNREDVSVTIAGPWSSERDEKELMTQIKNDSIELGLDLMQKINFLGPIKGDVSKLNLYKNSDVFVFPSYIDTFPLVVLEAMELGVPVIAYEQGAIVDMLSQGSGVVVEKGNINMLEASIESLLESDSTRVATAKSAAGRVKNLYSRDNYKLNFLKMFKGCK